MEPKLDEAGYELGWGYAEPVKAVWGAGGAGDVWVELSEVALGGQAACIQKVYLMCGFEIGATSG